MRSQVTALFLLSNATVLLAHINAISSFVTKLKGVKGVHKQKFPFCREDYHSQHRYYYTQAAHIKVSKGPVDFLHLQICQDSFFFLIIIYFLRGNSFYEYHCHLGFHKPNDFEVFISLANFDIKIISQQSIFCFTFLPLNFPNMEDAVFGYLYFASGAQMVFLCPRVKFMTSNFRYLIIS